MILVTGASGHVGNVLVRELVSRGEEVLIMTQSGEMPPYLNHLDIDVCQGDLYDKLSIDRAVSKARIVFHLAGMISISSFKDKKLTSVNVHGTQFIVEACIKHKVERLIYTSSVHALIEPEHGVAIKEQESFESSNLFGAYAQTKAEATEVVLDGVKRGLDAVICFPSGIMGPMDFLGSEAGRMVKEYASNKLSAYIDGAYNFVDVRDVAKGLILAKEKGRKGEGYILAGEEMSMTYFFEILSEYLPQLKIPKRKIPIPLAISLAWVVESVCKVVRIKPKFTVYAIKVLQSNCNISSDKARVELGYTSRSIKECIKDTLFWLKESKRI